MSSTEVRADVETTWVHLRDGDHVISAYAARPRGAAPTAGILLCHDRHGISESEPDREHQHSYQTCEELAGEGYLALCVDLFSHGSREGHSLTDERTMRELGLGLGYLTEQVSPAPLGVIGFCMGGRTALLAATYFPQIVALADFYGRALNSSYEPDRHPEHPMDRLHLLKAAVHAHFGADDAGIPLTETSLLDANLEKLGIAHTVIVHPGAGHGFFNHTDQKSYRPEIARQAWADTLRFFADTLGPKK